MFISIGSKGLSRLVSCTKILTRYSRSMVAAVNPSETKSLVGILQMTSTSDKDSNFKQVCSLVEEAHKQGVKMVFLPECCDYIAESTEHTLGLSETINGELMERYKELSKKFNMWVSVGSFHQKSPQAEKPSRICNTNVIIDSSGNIVSEYNKIHLFDFTGSSPTSHPLRESNYTEAGNKIVPPVQTPVGKLGQCICYDLRFPEMSTTLREMGAELLAYPSAFTVPTGQAHWQILLRSRAIETQCYVLAPAQVGHHNHKRTSYGHAMIVDPWGKVVAECQNDQPGLCVGEIDLSFLSKIRRNMPVLEHRRKTLYKLSHPLTSKIDSQEFYDFGGQQIKSSVVFFSTLHSFAFVNISPVLPGHVLVASRRKVPRLKDLTDQEMTDVFNTVQVVSKVLEPMFGANSLTVSIQDGEEAGQTVKHLHVHMLPRKAGDFKEKDDIYDRLEKHDKDEKRIKRSEQVMEAEAKQIREAIEKGDYT